MTEESGRSVCTDAHASPSLDLPGGSLSLVCDSEECGEKEPQWCLTDVDAGAFELDGRRKSG